MDTTTSFRNIFLAQFPKLSAHLRYGVLKAFGDFRGQIDLGSDIDLVIDKKEKQNWIDLAQQAQGLKSLQIQEKGNVSHLQLYFKDQSYLELDLLVELRRKKWGFMEIEKVLEKVEISSSGWKKCRDVDSLVYVFWFYGLNKAPVPDKYISHFEALSSSEKEEFSNNLGWTIDSMGFSLLKNAHLISEMNKNKLALKKGNGIFNQWIRNASTLFFSITKPAPTITFSGVDGAGKSTIINAFKEILVEKYRRKLVVLRHRPSILPILSSYKYGKEAAEQRAADRLPRQGKNQNKMLSIFRFAYYFVDYLLGQFFIYCNYNLRGCTVLYDRYYYDFIVDAKRSNLVFSPVWAKRLFAFLFKPELNFLIYAAPETILARKQELSKKDIENLTAGYQSLFKELDDTHPKRRFVGVKNVHLDNTLAQIETQFLNQVCHA